MTHDVVHLREALRTSHERLARLMTAPAPPSATSSAYTKEWTVADVMSHLGSGAEVFSLILDRLQNGQAAPVQDDFIVIWDRWNAKTPEEQVRDGLRSDAAFVDKALAAGDEVATVPAFGSVMSLAEFLAMRLQEHVVHTWDVEVSIDGAASIPAVHVPFLLEQLPTVAPRSAREVSVRRTVRVGVTSPEADFEVALDAETTLTRTDPVGASEVTMPAECFVRLVFGRLSAVRAAVKSPEEADVADYLAAAFVGY